MPTPVIEGVYRVAFNWETDGPVQHAVNVMHFLCPTSGDRSNDVHDQIVTAMEAANTTDSDPWTYITNHAALKTLDITPLDGVSPTHTYDITGQNGDLDGDWIPAACQVITLRTDHGGRSARGRIYLPFIAEAGWDAGSLVSSDRGGNDLGWQRMQEHLDGTNEKSVEWVVASYKLGEAFGVLHAVPQYVAATQRRRQSRLR